MKFGSRMDIFLPRHATISARIGDKVVGGVTVVAMLQEARAVQSAEPQLNVVH
jgi:hypothetical protein